MARRTPLALTALVALSCVGWLGCSSSQGDAPEQGSSTGSVATSDDPEADTTGGTTTDAPGGTTEADGSSPDGASSSSSGNGAAACLALEEELQEIAQQFHQTQELVGLSVSVGTASCPPWSASWGVAELPDTALTPSHLLRVGSVTKTYTAALLLKLAEDGQLTLDDTLELWELDVPGASEITIRQLLNHTSGLADYQNNPDFVTALQQDPSQVWDPHVLVEYALALPPVGTPGSAHAYSNANYILAALIAESAGGETYAELLRSHVFAPVGLAHSYLEDVETWTEPTAAGYLVVDDGPPQATAGQYHASAAWSAGAIVATADDVRQWIAALLTSDFLNAASQAELVELVDDIATDGYGLGIFRVQFEDVSAFGHNGAVLGFQASGYYDPGVGTTVSVLKNELSIDAAGTPSGEPTNLALALLQAVND